MDLLTRAVDGLESLLGHSPHPAIVAVPLGALGGLGAKLVLALARRSMALHVSGRAIH